MFIRRKTVVNYADEKLYDCSNSNNKNYKN